MKKNIKRLRSGFSVAELLISMLIAMIIAAALVPVIGPKRVQRPSNRLNHGIAECFYDENGVLTYFYADNDPNSETIRETVPSGQNYCTFNAPSADYFEMITVGTGGDGYQNMDSLNYQITNAGSGTEGYSYSGEISGNANFQRDIAASARITTPIGTRYDYSIPDAIRRALNKWAEENNTTSKIRFELTSPVGNGGLGRCRVQYRENYTSLNQCADCVNGLAYCPPYTSGSGNVYSIASISDSDWGDSCWTYVHGNGGPSGAGYIVKSEFILRGDTNIKFYENYDKTRLELTDGSSSDPAYINLSKSGNGQEPTWLSEHLMYSTGESGNNSVCTSNIEGGCSNISSDTIIHTGGEGGNPSPNNAYGCFKGGESRTRGIIKLANFQSEYRNSDKILKWGINDGVISGAFGGKGEYGGEASVVYEKLNGTLYMFPAAKNLDGYPNNNVSYIVRNPNQSLDNSISKTVNGADKTSNTIGQYNIVFSQIPIQKTVKDIAVADNENHFKYLVKVKTTMTKIGMGANVSGTTLVDCNTNGRDFCPGFAGSGVYSYLDFDKDEDGRYILPSMHSITLKNYNTGQSYYMPVENLSSVIPSGENDCQSGDTKIGEDSRTYGEINYYPRFCKSGKQRGNSGAVIIIW